MPLNKLLRHPLLLASVVVLAAAAAGFSMARIRTLIAPGTFATAPVLNLTQDDDQDSGANEVSPAQVEQYVNVYKAMQHDRKLTVDQATATQHISVEQFRDIEARIERDGVLRERVRRELLKAAEDKSNALKLKPQSAPSPSKP